MKMITINYLSGEEAAVVLEGGKITSVEVIKAGTGNDLGGSASGFIGIEPTHNELWLQDICGMFDGKSCKSSCSSVCQNRGPVAILVPLKESET